MAGDGGQHNQGLIFKHTTDINNLTLASSTQMLNIAKSHRIWPSVRKC